MKSNNINILSKTNLANNILNNCQYLANAYKFLFLKFENINTL